MKTKCSTTKGHQQFCIEACAEHMLHFSVGARFREEWKTLVCPIIQRTNTQQYPMPPQPQLISGGFLFPISTPSRVSNPVSNSVGDSARRCDWLLGLSRGTYFPFPLTLYQITFISLQKIRTMSRISSVFTSGHHESSLFHPQSKPWLVVELWIHAKMDSGDTWNTQIQA